MSLLAAVLLFSGCAALDHGVHVSRHHLALMSQRVPVDKVLAKPAADAAMAETQARLQALQRARSFAITQLHLPDNGSYLSYVGLPGRFVVWNVFAAPKLSLQPKTWCYPVVGCAVYRGYFSKDKAGREAARWRARGWDVSVGGVVAYSTLGRWRDPVLSSMLTAEPMRDAQLLFHELAHQVLYVKNDSAFNESFAFFVEQQGGQAWLTHQAQPVGPWRLKWQRDAMYRARLMTTHADLTQMYASAISNAEKQTQKTKLFAQLHHDIESNFGAHYRKPSNNAELMAGQTYHQWHDAFANLFMTCEQDWPRFYQQVAKLAALTKPQREQQLRALLTDQR